MPPGQRRNKAGSAVFIYPVGVLCLFGPVMLLTGAITEGLIMVGLGACLIAALIYRSRRD